MAHDAEDRARAELDRLQERGVHLAKACVFYEDGSVACPKDAWPVPAVASTHPAPDVEHGTAGDQARPGESTEQLRARHPRTAPPDGPRLST